MIIWTNRKWIGDDHHPLLNQERKLRNILVVDQSDSWLVFDVFMIILLFLYMRPTEKRADKMKQPVFHNQYIDVLFPIAWWILSAGSRHSTTIGICNNFIILTKPAREIFPKKDHISRWGFPQSWGIPSRHQGCFNTQRHHDWMITGVPLWLRKPQYGPITGLVGKIYRKAWFFPSDIGLWLPTLLTTEGTEQTKNSVGKGVKNL